MEINNCKDISKATILIVVSLFLSCVWWYYYQYDFDSTFTHPYVLRANGTVGTLTYKTHIHWTLLAEIISPLLLLMARGYAPEMNISTRGKLYGDLWFWNMVFIVMKVVDFLLTYRTTDFRIYAIIVLMVLHLYYVVTTWINWYEKNH